MSILFLGNLKAEDYSGFLVGYTKHIAEDPHDSGSSTYFKDPEEGDWRLIASFLRPQTDTWFAGPYSFLENFKPEEGYKIFIKILNCFQYNPLREGVQTH